MNASVATIYSPSGGIRQCRSAHGRLTLGRLALAVMTVFALSGCSAISIPLGEATGTSDMNAPIDLTGSISDTTDLDVGPDDRRYIAAVVPAHIADPTDQALLSWSNPDTGNSGTIIEIVPADPNGIRGCARFTTSANTFAGLRNYTGMACPDSFKAWHVTLLERVEIDS